MKVDFNKNSSLYTVVGTALLGAVALAIAKALKIGSPKASQGKLDVHPKPDQVIRIFAHFQLSHKKIMCGEPKLKQKDRIKEGKLVVEWGGTETMSQNAPTNKQKTQLYLNDTLLQKVI